MKCKFFIGLLGFAILMLSLVGMVSYRLYAKISFSSALTTPPIHELLNAVLKNFVSDGQVNYQQLHENEEQLNINLARLQSHAPTVNWSRE